MKYLNGNNQYATTQRFIGHDMLFRGFIVKDWCGNNEEYTKNRKLNKIFVKHCVRHYWKCWEDRNNWAKKPEIRRQRKIDWYKSEMNETRVNGNSEVMRYVRDHDVCVEHRSTDAI